MSLGHSLVCIATQFADVDETLVVLETQARSLARDRKHTRKWKAHEREKRTSACIGVREVLGQMLGTTRRGSRTKSAINNTQTSGYVRTTE